MTDEFDPLHGWDPTPGIVGVYATLDGRATVWRRVAGVLVREDVRFRPWLLLDRADDVERGMYPGSGIEIRELKGDGALRFHVSADDGNTLAAAVLNGASQRLAQPLSHLSELERIEPESTLTLQPEEQYLVATGRTYFRDLPYDDLQRLQFDLETTGLDPARDRVFMISIRYANGETEVLEAEGESPVAEAGLIRRLVDRIRLADPDVIENHNLHGFDLPFLDRRARKLRVTLAIGRVDGAPLRLRAARRGVTRIEATGRGRFDDDDRRVRFIAPGRELIDTLDFTRRRDFAARDLPGHGLKAVAKHFGVAAPDREYIAGAEIHSTYLTDPERVRRYATDDVEEVAAISRLLGGATYALAQLVPRRYERLADAGPATGVIDPLLVRAYMRADTALPKHEMSDGTEHTGAALFLFASGVAHRVVKADVASLYPSLMRAYRIGPSRDTLGALLAMVDSLVERRLEAKTNARIAPPGSAARHEFEAVSGALKIVVNAAYGYLGAGGLTRFADIHAANEVTRRGREVLGIMCTELAKRGVTLIEADTDGVYFAVPESWTEDDERRAVREVDALLPTLVQLEFEGRYAAMLSHEPKNYALLTTHGELILRGVAFRSSRSEPFGDRFLRAAIRQLLEGNVPAVREAYLDTISALRARALPTADVSARVRLSKTPQEYEESRPARRELQYEAMIAAGRLDWRRNERARVFRRANGEGGLLTDAHEHDPDNDPRDYDIEYYVRLLRSSFAERLSRAFTGDDFATVFSHPDQLSLFDDRMDSVRPILTVYGNAMVVESAE